MEDKIKNKLIPDLLDNKELKNTINFEGTDDYNVNAVTADVARHTMADLKLEPSISGRATEIEAKYEGNFDGNIDKAIKYVPSDGGKFTGPVQIDNAHGNYLGGTSEDEIISFGQIKTALSQLNGFPFCKWEVDYDDDDSYENDETTFTTIDNTNNEPYKLNVVVGRTVDLAYFENYADGKKNDKYVQDPTDLTYSEVKEGNNVIMYEVTGLAANASTSTEIHIPGTRQDKPVRLGDSVFANNRNIQTVYISRGVTYIGQGTFEGCTNLRHITIPDSITALEYGVFEGCASLTEVDLSRELTEIPQAAFYGCNGLEKITIGRKITKVYSSAFIECNNLSDIYFVGTKADWDKITIVDDSAAISGEGLISKLADGTITIHYGNMPFPFLYICKDGKDEGEDTSLTSNKMFLKLPDKDLIEISKGAVRLESTTSTGGYYTYETLAAIIAGLNTRLTGIGVDTLKVPDFVTIPSVLPEYIPEDTFEPESVPTLQGLQDEIEAIKGGDGTDGDNLTKIRADLDTLAKEVEIELKGELILEGVSSRLDAICDDLDSIEEDFTEHKEAIQKDLDNLKKDIQQEVSTKSLKIIKEDDESDTVTLKIDQFKKLLKLINCIDWDKS